jgi:superfamily I DNA/RNA helicase
MSWYAKVSKDIAYLPSGLDYFYNELIEAKAEVKIHGNVEKSSAALPGIVEHRFNQLQEIEAILEYLNIELRRIKSKAFRKYLENYQRALSSRDCEKYVDGEADVVDMEKIINEFAMLRNQWLGIVKGLDIKGYQINNIIKLRAAGLEDISL